MHQEETDENINIKEYYCCIDCSRKLIVPSGRYGEEEELACLDRRPEVNRTGGLSRCEHYKK